MPPEPENDVVDQQNTDQVPEQQEVVEPQLPDSFEEFYRNYNMSPEEPEAPDTDGDQSQEEIDANAPITYDQVQQMIGQQQAQQQPVDPSLQQHAEFGKQILENPVYRDALLEIIQNEQNPQEERPEIKAYDAPPKPPVKPVGFKMAKAMEDPDSIHARYLDEFQNFQEEKAAWETKALSTNIINSEKSRAYQEEKYNKQQEELQRQQQEEEQYLQQEQAVQAAYQELTSAPYNYTDAEAKAFISDVVSGNFQQDPAIFAQVWLMQHRSKNGQQIAGQNNLQTKQSLQDLQQKANQQYNNNVQPTNREPVRSPAGSGSGGGLPANQNTNAEPSPPNPMLAMGEYLLKEKRRQDRRLYG